MGTPAVTLRPIAGEDAPAVSAFLHRHLNDRVSARSWARLLDPPWRTPADHHGYALWEDDRLVGVYAAVYSTREGPDGPWSVCNLAAFCVLDEHRAQSLRLLRAVLAQKDLTYTDLSPSGNVVALNERLGFVHLDTRTRLTANLPMLPSRRTRVSEDPIALTKTLTGTDAVVYADHREAPASRHLLAVTDRGYAYLLFRRDRRKGLPLFATPLHAGGDPEILRSAWPHIASHLLVRHRLPFTLAEHRVLGFTPRLGIELAHPRPRMVRGHTDPSRIDYLYSELTLVEW